MDQSHANLQQDHPRVCGEKFRAYAKIWNEWGSPPRMRGKEAPAAHHHRTAGITPAYAGKRQERSSYRTNRRDHPRVCGEKSFTRLSYCSAGGSPPRVRGKVPVCCPEHRKVRITPAYAGKRDLVISESGDIEDHPRVCGEKQSRQRCRMSRTGSPPRMRGKDGVNDSAQAVTGITPACAGKSSAARRARQPSRDHPRVCGEKTEYRALVTAHQGSPPRMRGKVDLSLKVVRVLGITPAYAEKRAAQAGRAVGHGQNYDGSSPASRSK